ncbi:unnamed protein product [Durusdinium trenchii]|uniref:Uncharacterized protein n=1 Tax=Durusdinium trenchii TaxID=1381693 RepID=A0ABP0PC03_9DINO
MKTAMRFEIMLAERRKLESCRDQNDEELLASIISRYNSYRAVSAVKKWQINSDMQSAIFAIIRGLTAETRALVRQHLDFNKYDESYNEGLLRAKRHQLNETPRGMPAAWADRLTVTEQAQLLHFKRYNQWWHLNCKKVKKTMRARLRWTEEVWNRSVDQACLASWAVDECRKNPKAST